MKGRSRLGEADDICREVELNRLTEEDGIIHLCTVLPISEKSAKLLLTHNYLPLKRYGAGVARSRKGN